MAKSVNKLMLLGNLGRDPEVKTARSGALVATISLATSERFKQGEEWKDRTEWHYVTLFGKLAEIARDYVHKGDKLFVQARLRQDSYDDNGTTRYRTNIIAEELTLLGSSGGRSNASQPGAYSGGSPLTDEDIPF